MRIIKNFIDDDDVKAIKNISDKFSSNYELGRQGTGYLKLNILKNVSPTYIIDFVHKTNLFHRSLSEMKATANIKWDAYIIKYPIGSHIPSHTDKVNNRFEHHRMNIIVEQGKDQVISIDNIIYGSIEPKDAYVFRPDLEEHFVSKVQFCERIVFSVGFLQKNND